MSDQQRSTVLPAGDGIDPPGGVWTFHSPGVASVFDSHVALSTPGYDDLQRLIARMATYFLVDGGSVVDYGCATGRTIAEIQAANPARRVRYVGVDESAPMCDQARKRAPFAEFHNLRLALFPPPPDTCLALAIYTLQFMPPADREAALRMMAGSMRTGSGLVLVEKTIADEAFFAIPFNDIHHDEKLEAYSPEEVTGKARSLRGVLRAIPSQETEAMLTAAGWRPQRFWQHLAFAGWVCTRR